jgi:hypothetical protein
MKVKLDFWPQMARITQILGIKKDGFLEENTKGAGAGHLLGGSKIQESRLGSKTKRLIRRCEKN